MLVQMQSEKRKKIQLWQAKGLKLNRMEMTSNSILSIYSKLTIIWLLTIDFKDKYEFWKMNESDVWICSFYILIIICDFRPIRKKCSYCNVEVVTYVEHEGHPLFLLIAMLVVIIFGFLSFIILPIGYLATKNAVHRCSRCLQKMGEKRCFGIPTNFSD
jgi:hypothetical protein